MKPPLLHPCRLWACPCLTSFARTGLGKSCLRQFRGTTALFLTVVGLVFFALLAPGRAQKPGSLDTSFDPGTGVKGALNAFAVQPDGKIVIGGVFPSVNGTARNSIARLNADGTLDLRFDPGTGADREVKAVTVQPDGKIVIGGVFTTINGTAHRALARLNANGSVDPSFNAGAVSGNVFALALQPDGKLVVGGIFSITDQTGHDQIVRFNPDGSVDPSFAPTKITKAILSLALQPDGKVLVGGLFTTLAGGAHDYLERLNADGSADPGFTGAGLNGIVQSLAVQADGKVLIGGGFSALGNTRRYGFARLNADGSPDAAFNTGIGVDGSGVSASAMQADGKVLIGGEFKTVNGVPRIGLARLNADGSLDETFNAAINGAGFVSALVLQADGKALIGGSFTTLGGVSRLSVARVSTVDASASIKPAISVVLQSDGIASAPGGKAIAIVSRAGGDLSEALTVFYNVKGNAVAGVNYVPLTGSVLIPAGKTGAKIKVKALDDPAFQGEKVVKIVLRVDPNGRYNLTGGASAKAKFKVVDPQ